MEPISILTRVRVITVVLTIFGMILGGMYLLAKYHQGQAVVLLLLGVMLCPREREEWTGILRCVHDRGAR